MLKWIDKHPRRSVVLLGAFLIIVSLVANNEMSEPHTAFVVICLPIAMYAWIRRRQRRYAGGRGTNEPKDLQSQSR
jgi:hypothetical protein